MTRPTRIEVNCTTGETTVHELTEAEMTQREADRVAHEAMQAEQEATATALATLKASARAGLVAGRPLTPAEAATLIPHE